jgi:methionyl-tRNA formyltransferase
MTRIAFLGTPEVAVPALRVLAAEAGVAAVFCNPDRPKGRGRDLQAPPVKAAALELGLPVHQPERWKDPDTRGLWESLHIDLALVVAYGHILPSWMLDSCALGAWNLHFSLLPKWRGAAPVNHAILAGDAETGVSLMRLEPGLDAGPVLARCRRPILPSDDAEGLLALLAVDAAELLRGHLPGMLDGSARPEAQDAAQATFAPKLSKEMARLDPREDAAVLHRRVRALQPWPGTELGFEGTVLKVCAVGGLRPCVEAAGTLRWDRAGAWLSAGNGQAVELTRLQRPGKPIQPAPQALQPWGAEGCRAVAQDGDG